MRRRSDDVGDRLSEVAARNGIVTDDLERILLTDDTAHLDRHGLLFYVDPAPDPDVLATSGDRNRPPKPPSRTPTHSCSTASRIEPDDLPRLQWSHPPGRQRLDRHLVHGAGLRLQRRTRGPSPTPRRTSSRASGSGSPRTTPPSTSNVTTQDPGFAAINRSSTSDQIYGTRALVTNTFDFEICGSCGGIAYLGVFDHSFDHTYLPAGLVLRRLAVRDQSDRRVPCRTRWATTSGWTTTVKYPVTAATTSATSRGRRSWGWATTSPLSSSARASTPTPPTPRATSP